MSLQTFIENAEDRFWRTDRKDGRNNIYVLRSNDVNTPSVHDPIIGVMETPELAHMVVTTHNTLLQKFGKRFPKVIQTL